MQVPFFVGAIVPMSVADWGVRWGSRLLFLCQNWFSSHLLSSRGRASNVDPADDQ
jgi:hypothetical protein